MNSVRASNILLYGFFLFLETHNSAINYVPFFANYIFNNNHIVHVAYGNVHVCVFSMFVGFMLNEAAELFCKFSFSYHTCTCKLI